MTIREANQYESQGWKHIHIWKFSHVALGFISNATVYECRCGTCKIVTSNGVESTYRGWYANAMTK